jgi:mono/diheme cytochrome c family protein
MIKKILVISTTWWIFLSTGAVQAEDAVLGEELYKGRCLGCHKEAPYGKGPPMAQSQESLRSMAKLWDSISPGTLWTKQDLDDVVSYLNKKYYHY